jgi:hypothetical protein|nr:MAG TPA: hypothetical protein [Caudoviricetes sp.]
MARGKLTNLGATSSGVLSSRTSAPFSITFRHKLLNGYRFSDLKRENYKELQSFLDKVCGVPFDIVDKLYRRKSDGNDLYDGDQIIHYEVTGKFRIHGIIENAQFIVLRLDPEHKFHS